jgi:spore coat protein A
MFLNKKFVPIICLLIASISITNQSLGQVLLDPLTQPQFVNTLTIPPTIDGRSGGVVDMSVTQKSFKLGIINPITKAPLSTTMWSYNGSVPGPTILASKGTPLKINWLNKLTDVSGKFLPHLLPVDESLEWAFTNTSNTIQNVGVPLVTHLHGGLSESASDGQPNAWVTPTDANKNFVTGMDFIKGGSVSPYYYSNNQEAASIWYHDHTMGISRLNVYAGLAGSYLITDRNEKSLKEDKKLPADRYDIVLNIQDKMFTEDGQLFYPSTFEGAPNPNASALPEFYGDFILVNGKIWPILDVEPRLYRFRLVNGSDSRFYNMSLSNGNSIAVIASDDGLLPKRVITNTVLLAPGERKDIIIDFSKNKGKTFYISNDANSPYPGGDPVDPNTTGKIMAFRVSKPLNKEISMTELPSSSLRPAIVPLKPTAPLLPRKLILFEREDQFGRLKPSLGTVDNGAMDYMQEPTEMPLQGTTEIWEIYNETMDAHPIHLHAVTMQIIDRRKFTATIDPINGKPTNITLVGNPILPPADEKGWKDTYVMYPGEVTRVIATFNLPGMYVWHCHILSHEDNEMMRPLHIMPMDQANMPIAGGAANQMEKMEQKIGLSVAPNPFSNVVTISFKTDKTSTIGLDLYDVNGVKVKAIYQGSKPAGPQQFNIDGSQLPNGTYFNVITIEGVKIARKLILQK